MSPKISRRDHLKPSFGFSTTILAIRGDKSETCDMKEATTTADSRKTRDVKSQ